MLRMHLWGMLGMGGGFRFNFNLQKERGQISGPNSSVRLHPVLGLVGPGAGALAAVLQVQLVAVDAVKLLDLDAGLGHDGTSL